MALTITSNLTTVDDADAVTGWGVNSNIAAGWGLNTDEGVQRTSGNGGYCISGQSKNTTQGIIYFDNGADIDLTSEWLRVWLRFTEIGKMNAFSGSPPGATIYIEDSSGNWGEWSIGGSNGGLSEAWENYVVDTSASFFNTSATAPTMTAIRRIGVGVKMFTKPSRADNIFIDAIRYGDGLTITGTNAIAGDGWAEVAAEDEDNNNQYGVFRRDQTGNYVLKGKLIFGDSAGTGSVDFTDNKNSKIFIPRFHFEDDHRGYGVSPSGRDSFGIELVGNGTGTTDFQLGDVLGTGNSRQGLLGGTISSLGREPFILDAETDTSDIDSCNLYGVTFEGAGIVQLAGSTTQEAIGCTFIGGDEIQANTTEFLNNKVIAPVGRGIELLASNQVELIDFIAGSSETQPIQKCGYHDSTTLSWSVFRNQLIEANDDTAGDVDPWSTSTTGLARWYLGYFNRYGRLKINTSTARVGGGTPVWEYWNGSTWASLTFISDGTNTLTTTGEQDLVFVPPSDWAKLSLLGVDPEYWYVRLRATATRTTNPAVTRVKVDDIYEEAVHVPVAGTIDAIDLQFSGYPTPSDGFKYQIENSADATTMDSYADTNQDSTQALGNGTIEAVGQSVTGNGGVLSRIRVDLSKTLSPTGTMVATVYTHSGTFGTSSVPTGAVLATSNTINVADLTTTLTLTDFEFEDEVTLTNTTKYVIALEYAGGDASNYVNVGTDTSTPSHGGNFSTYNGATWTAVSGTDAIFYVYTGGIVKLTAVGGNPATAIETGSPPGATIIDQSVNIDVKVIDASDLSNVQGARVYITADAGGDLTEGDEILTPNSQTTDSNGEVSDTFSFTSDQPIIGWVRRGTTTPLYKESPISGTITNEGFSATVAMVLDE